MQREPCNIESWISILLYCVCCMQFFLEIKFEAILLYCVSCVQFFPEIKFEVLSPHYTMTTLSLATKTAASLPRYFLREAGLAGRRGFCCLLLATKLSTCNVGLIVKTSLYPLPLSEILYQSFVMLGIKLSNRL